MKLDLWHLFKRRGLYDLHPELANRQPLLRDSSDAASAPIGTDPSSAYTSHAWTYKAVSTIATAIAPLVVRVVGADDAEVETHPLTALLASPSAAMGAADLWRTWAMNMLLWGEAGIEVVYSVNGTKPLEMWLRRSLDYDVVVDPKQRRYGGVVGYRIHDGQGDPYTLTLREFAHTRYADPRNPLRGLAPISAIRDSITMDRVSARWSLGFFRNQARPDFAIITPQGLSPSERERLESQFLEKYQGPENAHRPVLLEQGVTDIKPFAFPPKDTEWLAARQMTREEIGAIFGVPDEIMGWGRDTYENYGQSLRVFWQLTLVPMIQLRDDVLTRWARQAGLLAMGERVVTDLHSVDALQEDRTPKLEQASKLFGMGVPFNTINATLGLGVGDVPGGTTGYLPLALVPVGTTSAEPAPAPAAQLAYRSLGRERPVPYGGALHRALYAIYRTATDQASAAMARQLKREFQKQQDRVSVPIRQGVTDVDDVFDVYDEERLWREAFRPTISSIVDAGGHAAIAEIGGGIAWDLHDPNVQDAITRITWRFVEEITDTTYDALKTLLANATEEGLSIPEISDRLGNLYEGFKGHRSEVIARTETCKGYNLGSLEGYEQGGVEKRGWLATLDDRVRDTHAELHGVELPLDEPFELGEYKVMYPGDPAAGPEEICNCRCATYAV